jgi:predicted transcriptional regulator
MTKPVLLSIKPAYVDRILEGTKTVELRRWRPSWKAGTVIVIYASAPRKAVQALAEMSALIELSPSAMWREHHNRLGITRESFERYFGGRPSAYGIALDRVHGVPAQVLRSRPPQKFEYLSETHPAHDELLRLVHEYTLAKGSR